ncbi:MAG: YccF domain-containing protein [Chloroflexota bacterium]|nr:YccF domain-containing protein [Chloroflexota bacterium]
MNTAPIMQQSAYPCPQCNAPIFAGQEICGNCKLPLDQQSLARFHAARPIQYSPPQQYTQPYGQPYAPPQQYAQPYPPPQPGYYAPPTPQVVNVVVQQHVSQINTTVVGGRKSSVPLWLQITYFLFIGWWAGFVWLGICLALMATIIGFPFGVLGLKFLPTAFFLA